MNLLHKDFAEIVQLIQKARTNALKNVNTELIDLYWQIGKYISQKVEREEWGKGVVDQLAQYLKTNHPVLKGFTRRNLYRMKQFYEEYRDSPHLLPLLRNLPWSSHLHIISKTKSIEEKEFYLRLAIRERYSVRELERQIDSGYYERTMLSKQKVSTVLAQMQSDVSTIFKDQYVFEFLELPDPFSEQDLQKGLVKNLKRFLLELGKDFSFIGEEYRLQVGNHDYYIDLLFFHRELSCLVAFDLKIDDFKPEYMGKMNFYLEALDRDVKKPHENPSVGVILCKSKDTEVVEFALSRSLSPTMIAEYETKLIDKKLLQQRLHELFM